MDFVKDFWLRKDFRNAIGKRTNLSEHRLEMRAKNIIVHDYSGTQHYKIPRSAVFRAPGLFCTCDPKFVRLLLMPAKRNNLQQLKKAFDTQQVEFPKVN